MSNGWIKLHRIIEENEFYFSEKFTKTQAWIDLLILARVTPGTMYIRGNEIALKVGEIGRSKLTLSKRWKWNERTVTNFLKLLKNRGMIQYRTTSVTTIITILNWKIYQGDTEQTTKQNTKQTQSRIHTNKNDKNVKNEKKRSLQIFSSKDLKAEEQNKVNDALDALPLEENLLKSDLPAGEKKQVKKGNRRFSFNRPL